LHYNKNDDWLNDDTTLRIIRYNHINADQEKSTLRAATIGAIKKAANYGNFWGGQFMGIMQVVREWKRLNYNLSWILEALYKTDITHRWQLKQFIKIFWNHVQCGC
jgi:hypothetical protein